LSRKQSESQNGGQRPFYRPQRGEKASFFVTSLLHIRPDSSPNPKVPWVAGSNAFLKIRFAMPAALRMGIVISSASSQERKQIYRRCVVRRTGATRLKAMRRPDPGVTAV
jgi:hypothetical protein